MSVGSIEFIETYDLGDLFPMYKRVTNGRNYYDCLLVNIYNVYYTFTPPTEFVENFSFLEIYNDSVNFFVFK